MKSSTDQLIKEGHLAIRRGEKEKARQLLEQASVQNPKDYRIWLGLAAVSKTPHESLAMIDKADALNPDHPAILQARKWAEGLVSKSEAAVNTAKPIPVPIRQDPNPVKKEPIAVPVPIETSNFNGKLLLRRVVSGAVILTIIVALGILTLYGFNMLQNGNELAGNMTNEPAEETQSETEIALAPEVEVSNILPEEEVVVEAVETPTVTPNPIQPKDILQESSESRPRWTVTPLPTPTFTPSPTWVPTFVSPIDESGILKPLGLLPSERWIDISLSTQSLVAFEGDTPVFETLISSGLAAYPTVVGQFRIWLRFTSQTMDGARLGYDYYLEDVPYVQYFYEDYALHGAYWHNNFGNPMSHGCVNLSIPDSEWIYNFTDYGTLVNVHE